MKRPAGHSVQTEALPAASHTHAITHIKGAHTRTHVHARTHARTLVGR